MTSLIFTLFYAVLLYFLAWQADNIVLIVLGYLAAAWMFTAACIVAWRMARENN
jgi:hypothetical protein